MRNGAIERAMHLIPDIAVFQERLACNLQDRRNRAKILGGALFDRAVKTRFICTIGPKTGDQEALARLHSAGMNIARVNGATNIATGLWLTKKSESNLVILSGDVIFDPTILEDLLAAEGDVVLAVERRTTFDADIRRICPGRLCARSGHFMGLSVHCEVGHRPP
jgi:hypothetical protein